MKNEWSYKKLEEVCDILDSLRKPISKKNRKEGPYPYYGASKIVDWIDDYIFTEKLVLVGEDGAKWGSGENSSFIADGKYWVNNHAHVIRPKANILHEWITYYLNFSNLNYLITGVTVPKLNQAKLKSINLPLPDINEQKRIVEKLDMCMEQIDKAIQNVEQNIQNAEELFQSYLNKIFSQKNNQWVNSEFGKIYDVRDGTHDSPKYQSEGYPLVTSKNLKNGKIVLNKIKYISFNDYSNINKRSRVDVGDVLFAMIGTIGNPVVIIEEPNFAIKNVALFKVPNTQNSHFLKYFLDSNIVRNKMQVDAKGSTQRFVGLGYLRSFRIDIPSKEIQDHLVSRINVFKSQNDLVFSNYKLELQSLNELKQSILEKAFNGEL